MAFWEFLIQKEGDRSWLPLESPNVEILEGRYRVVARTNRVSASVEIRVTHLAIAEHPPKRRIQKRHSQTNPDGLLVVIPFTRLQPGIWELRCAGDIMSDMLGEGWHHRVQLQVVPQESGLSEDWEADWHGEEDAAYTAERQMAAPDEPVAEPAPAVVELAPAEEAVIPAAAVPTPDAQPELQPVAATAELTASEAAAETQPSINVSSAFLKDVNQISEELVDSVFQDLDISIEPLEEVVPSGPSFTAEADEPATFRLILNQDHYAVRRGQTLTLAGRIEQLEGGADAIPPAELRVYLRDPQSAQVLSESKQALAARALPRPFIGTVALPDTPQTRLVLGELVLVGNVGSASETILGTHAFTVTADLDDLLEAIANDFSSDLEPPLEFADVSDESDLDLNLLNLLNAPQPAISLQPSHGQVLPPQLYQPDPEKAKAKPLELPFVAPVTPPTPASEVTAEPEATVSDAAAPAVESDPVAEPAASEQSAAMEAIADDLADSPLEWHESYFERFETNKPEQPATVISAEDLAFQSLNLQHRFLSRLNAMAADIELSMSLRSDVTPGFDTDLSAEEVMVEDDIPLPPPIRRSSLYKPPHADADEPLLIPADMPIPLPQLDVPAGELTSGQRLEVAVKLPMTPSRLYVKMWVLDRQTRSILDGPRWMMGFYPNGRGELETQAQFNVPYGCMEALFEAIALEMATQRESDKVSIERKIVPPDLPKLSVDELEI